MKKLNSIFLLIALVAMATLGACGKKGSSSSKNRNDYYYPYGNNAFNNNNWNNNFASGTQGLGYLQNLCGGSWCAQYYGQTYYNNVPCYQYQMYYPSYGWYPTYVPMYANQGFGQSGLSLSLGAYFAF